MARKRETIRKRREMTRAWKAMIKDHCATNCIVCETERTTNPTHVCDACLVKEDADVSWALPEQEVMEFPEIATMYQVSPAFADAIRAMVKEYNDQ